MAGIPGQKRGKELVAPNSWPRGQYSTDKQQQCRHIKSKIQKQNAHFLCTVATFISGDPLDHLSFCVHFPTIFSPEILVKETSKNIYTLSTPSPSLITHLPSSDTTAAATAGAAASSLREGGTTTITATPIVATNTFFNLHYSCHFIHGVILV